MEFSKIAAEDEIGPEGTEDVGAGAGEEGAEVGVGRDGAAEDAGDDGGAEGVEEGGEFVGEEAEEFAICNLRFAIEIHLRECQGEAEAPALAVGEIFWGEEIAASFRQADAGEVGEGGFDGGVGEVVDDGAAGEAKAGEVDEGNLQAAAQAAQEHGFAGAGGAGEEDDLAGEWTGEMGEGCGGEAGGGGFEVEPLGDEGAVEGRCCACGCGSKSQSVNFVNSGTRLGSIIDVADIDYGLARHSRSPLCCCAIDAIRAE